MSERAEVTTAAVEELAISPLQLRFREVMSGVASPVSVITTMHRGTPHGTTVSAFASLSLVPPMVLVSLDRTSQLLTRVRTSRRFGLNVMEASQSPLATVFASKGSQDRFAQVDWTIDNGLPHLVGSTGWLACEVYNMVTAGDHVVLMGAVAEARPGEHEGDPLTYYKRTFGTHVARVG